MSHTDAIVVLTSAATEEEAIRLVRALLESLPPAFSELHSHRVPEFLALPVSFGLDTYLERIDAETTLAVV